MRTEAADGYDAVQLAFEPVVDRKLTKGELGHLGRSASAGTATSSSSAGRASCNPASVTVEAFAPGDRIKVSGTSIGKGFKGTIKRHNFARGPMSHGSHNVRKPGSIGASATPSRVFKEQEDGRSDGREASRRSGSSSTRWTPSATSCSSGAPSPARRARGDQGGAALMALTSVASRALDAAAKRRLASSSVAPVASGYERSLRPSGGLLLALAHDLQRRAALMAPKAQVLGGTSKDVALGDRVRGRGEASPRPRDGAGGAQRGAARHARRREEPGLVAGGRAKPWRQKGTGRARQGTIRAPQFTGGGMAFPPGMRSFEVKVNREARRAALKGALSHHAANGTLTVLDASGFGAPSTRQAKELLAGWGQDTPVLVVAHEDEEAVVKSFRNLQRVLVTVPAELEVAAVVWARAVLVTEAALPLVGPGRQGGVGVSGPDERAGGAGPRRLREELLGHRRPALHVQGASGRAQDAGARQIEELFDVHVERVNIVKVQPKPKRRGLFRGTRPGWKKAIVQVREGETIEIFEAQV